jgi:hypothetical protein
VTKPLLADVASLGLLGDTVVPIALVAISKTRTPKQVSGNRNGCRRSRTAIGKAAGVRSPIAGAATAPRRTHRRQANEAQRWSSL